VLDTRTFRSPVAAPNNANKTLLGAAQKADLLAWLSSAQGRYKFLVSSVPWHNVIGGNDTWQGYAAERTEIFNHLRDNCISGVVLLSGDQHYVGVVRSSLAPGYNLYEISPTPLGTFPHDFPSTIDDPSVIFKYNSGRVFALIEVNTQEPSGLTLNVFNADNQSIYSLPLTEADISPACGEGDYTLHLPALKKR
jgi:alkaline phosphatase D